MIRQSQGFWSRLKKVIKQNGSYFKEPLKKMFAQCIVHAKTLLQDLKAHASFVYLNDLCITGIHMYDSHINVEGVPLISHLKKKPHFISSLM